MIKQKRAPSCVTWPRSARCQASVSYAQVFIVLALRGLKATIIFVEHNENVGKKRAAKMPHPNEIFGISISLLFLREEERVSGRGSIYTKP